MDYEQSVGSVRLVGTIAVTCPPTTPRTQKWMTTAIEYAPFADS